MKKPVFMLVLIMLVLVSLNPTPAIECGTLDDCPDEPCQNDACDDQEKSIPPLITYTKAPHMEDNQLFLELNITDGSLITKNQKVYVHHKKNVNNAVPENIYDLRESNNIYSVSITPPFPANYISVYAEDDFGNFNPNWADDYLRGPVAYAGEDFEVFAGDVLKTTIFQADYPKPEYLLFEWRILGDDRVLSIEPFFNRKLSPDYNPGEYQLELTVIDSSETTPKKSTDSVTVTVKQKEIPKCGNFDGNRDKCVNALTSLGLACFWCPYNMKCSPDCEACIGFPLIDEMKNECIAEELLKDNITNYESEDRMSFSSLKIAFLLLLLPILVIILSLFYFSAEKRRKRN